MTNQDLKLIQQENLSGYETMDTAEGNDDATYDYEIGILDGVQHRGGDKGDPV